MAKPAAKVEKNLVAKVRDFPVELQKSQKQLADQRVSFEQQLAELRKQTEQLVLKQKAEDLSLSQAKEQTHLATLNSLNAQISSLTNQD